MSLSLKIDNQFIALPDETEISIEASNPIFSDAGAKTYLFEIPIESLRYIIGRFGETVDLSRYDQQIDDILQELIRTKRALEVNTSGFGTAYDRLLPDTDILERYYAMGGRLITLASDAHTADRPGIGFDAAVQKLKAIGFSHACDFEKRKPILYEL